MSSLYLVAGLGNPGSEYERTRHNLGFLTVDELASRLDAGKLKRTRKHSAFVAEAHDGDGRLVLAKPQTMMNLSGRSIASLMGFYKVPLENVIVVHDELDLPFGVVRVKLGGGTAGHNGLRSIVQAVGDGFVRVRLGIGRPMGRKDPVAFVLEAFTKAEAEAVPGIVDRAADAVLMVAREGVGAAQTEFNKREREG
ncbi:MAG: aminoacyl-tRNA hydrolase [Actinomycetota bacterium]